jgi:septal ring factor EnvC (AmiA/AmiB activator)
LFSAEGRGTFSRVSEYRFEPPQPAPSGRRRPLLICALVLAFVLLAAAGSVAGYVASENRERAERWEGRADELERNVRSLNEILVERSDALNERTEELNAMAATVRRAERAVSRSEADVRSLEDRQRQLANEKAQVEDARAALAAEAEALEEVASAFITCKNGLVELLDHVLDEDFATASSVSSRVDGECQTAESELSAYLAAYGE